MREMATSPRDVALPALLAPAAGVGAAVALGNIGDGFVVAAVVFFGLLGRKAANKSKQDFFSAYAADRGLAYLGRVDWPADVPLLSIGSSRKLRDAVRGELPGGLEGTIANYSFFADSPHAYEGRRYNYVVAAFDLPKGRVPRFTLRGKGAMWDLEKHKAFKSRKPVELESVEFDHLYDLLLEGGDDQNWLRRLFSPAFIVETLERGIFDNPTWGRHAGGIETSETRLYVYAEGYGGNQKMLDAFAEGACRIARRARAEASR
jgi:hypothetical protein